MILLAMPLSVYILSGAHSQRGLKTRDSVTELRAERVSDGYWGFSFSLFGEVEGTFPSSLNWVSSFEFHQNCLFQRCCKRTLNIRIGRTFASACVQFPFINENSSFLTQLTYIQIFNHNIRLTFKSFYSVKLRTIC